MDFHNFSRSQGKSGIVFLCHGVAGKAIQALLIVIFCLAFASEGKALTVTLAKEGTEWTAVSSVPVGNGRAILYCRTKGTVFHWKIENASDRTLEDVRIMGRVYSGPSLKPVSKGEEGVGSRIGPQSSAVLSVGDWSLPVKIGDTVTVEFNGPCMSFSTMEARLEKEAAKKAEELAKQEEARKKAEDKKREAKIKAKEREQRQLEQRLEAEEQAEKEKEEKERLKRAKAEKEKAKKEKAKKEKAEKAIAKAEKQKGKKSKDDFWSGNTKPAKTVVAKNTPPKDDFWQGNTKPTKTVVAKAQPPKPTPASPPPVEKQPPPTPATQSGPYKTFTAAGKEWLVGDTGLSWDETQTWIKKQGGDWRTPTKEELNKLHQEVGRTSPIGDNCAWAESRDSESAWYFGFVNGNENWSYRSARVGYHRAVAVCSKNSSTKNSNENQPRLFLTIGH